MTIRREWLRFAVVAAVLFFVVLGVPFLYRIFTSLLTKAAPEDRLHRHLGRRTSGSTSSRFRPQGSIFLRANLPTRSTGHPEKTA
jgi:hypothetical protein